MYEVIIEINYSIYFICKLEIVKHTIKQGKNNCKTHTYYKYIYIVMACIIFGHLPSRGL